MHALGGLIPAWIWSQRANHQRAILQAVENKKKLDSRRCVTDRVSRISEEMVSKCAIQLPLTGSVLHSASSSSQRYSQPNRPSMRQAMQSHNKHMTLHRFTDANWRSYLPCVQSIVSCNNKNRWMKNECVEQKLFVPTCTPSQSVPVIFLPLTHAGPTVSRQGKSSYKII